MERNTIKMRNFTKYIVGFLVGVLIAACFGLFLLIFNKNYEISNRVQNIELLTQLYGENAVKNSDGLVSIQDVIQAQSDRIDQLQKDIEEIKAHPPKDGRNGKNGKDGSDGTDGTNGKDGVDGKTPVKGVDYDDGKDGVDGTTPYFEARCDPETTYWQARYAPDAAWEFMNGQKVKCTRKSWFGLP